MTRGLETANPPGDACHKHKLNMNCIALLELSDVGDEQSIMTGLYHPCVPPGPILVSSAAARPKQVGVRWCVYARYPRGRESHLSYGYAWPGGASQQLLPHRLRGHELPGTKHTRDRGDCTACLHFATRYKSSFSVA